MKTFFVPLFLYILNLGSGETLARLCGIATTLFLAHRYGVIVVGVYALAQTMVQYSLPFIDFGLRHVGARLVAQYPQAAEEIVDQVQKRRLTMTGRFCCPFCWFTRYRQNVPVELKIFLFVFAADGLSIFGFPGLAGLGQGAAPPHRSGQKPRSCRYSDLRSAAGQKFRIIFSGGLCWAAPSAMALQGNHLLDVVEEAADPPPRN